MPCPRIYCSSRARGLARIHPYHRHQRGTPVSLYARVPLFAPPTGNQSPCKKGPGSFCRPPKPLLPPVAPPRLQLHSGTQRNQNARSREGRGSRSGSGAGGDMSTTKDVTCRYFMQGVCREGNRCLFSHDLSTSKPSTICKFYQKGQCAYGTRCRYDHIRPPASSASGVVSGTRPLYASAPPFHSLNSLPDQNTLVTKTKVQEPGKREKKTLVLRDRDLCGSKEERTRSSTVSDSASCSVPMHAPETKPHSYLDAIRSGLEEEETEPGGSYTDGEQLCPYAAAGMCQFGDRCIYLHGQTCEICGLQVLHPFDPEQRKTHEKMCMATFEHEMEKAFAFQASQDKVCSICMEVVYDKPSASERRFGILSNCNHTYCLSCIRQWRGVKQFENPIIKSCPECRVISEFVIPSVYWVEDQTKKNELIEAFKQGVGRKACKYFDQGKGTCPFGGKCLYLHAYPDGRRAEPEKPRKQLSSEGTVRFLNSVRLWDFIEDRENRTLPVATDDVTEIGELFMRLSGTDAESAAPP